MVRDAESRKAASMIGTDSRSVTMRVEDLRIEIDDIDKALIRLLNRRARAAIEVGMLKRTAKAAAL
jgi:chorismate mutase